MIIGEGLGGLVVLALWIFCFIDVLVTPEKSCRNLPKLAWVFIVLLLPPIGPIAWLVAGHDWSGSAARVGATPSDISGITSGQSGRSGRAHSGRGGRYVSSNPDDDEEFIAGLRRRAEEQRRGSREQNDRPDGDGG